MTSIVDSEAHFLKRASEIHLDQPTIDALQRHGFRSLGQLAFAVGQPGQVIPETDFQNFCRTIVPSAAAACVASLRRLLFEAQTLAVQQLRLQLTSPESASKHVSEAERDRRMAHLRNTLVGLSIEGPMEPGRKVLDECAHQEATGQLKYLSPDKCVSRMHEVTHSKNPHKQISLEQNRLIIQDDVDELTMPASSALQAMEALKRRGIAYAFAQAVSWTSYDRYITKLFGHLHRDAPPGFGRISVSQVVEADRKVFARLIELDVKPRKAADGTYPLDKALEEALMSYEVSFCLMHQPLKGAGAPPARPNKRPREDQPGKARGKGRASSNKGKGRGKSSPPWVSIPKFLRDRGGVASMPSGEAVCFDYNIHGDKCKCKPDTCPRRHVCAKCFGSHPIKDHKD